VAVVIVGAAVLAGAAPASSLLDGAVVPAVSEAQPGATVSTAMSSAVACRRGVSIVGRRGSLARHSLPSRQVRGAA